jgi:hypothetical protein
LGAVEISPPFYILGVALKDIFQLAKVNKEVLHFKNFQAPNMDWKDILSFLFDEAEIENKELQKKINPDYKLDALGNIQIQEKFWLAPQTSSLFDRFSDIANLLYRVNDSQEDRACGYYNNQGCTCSLVWHSQGIRISLTSRTVSDHNDPYDILYWQVVGSSLWKINKDKVYELQPGDLLYFSKEDSHEVWCTEPRAGVIIDGVNLLSK